MRSVGRVRSLKESSATTPTDPVDALNALVQALRAIQAVLGDRPWLVLDLTMVQLKAVMLLAQTGGMPSRKLADALGIGPSAVTPLVDRLVQQRLTRRDHDP